MIVIEELLAAPAGLRQYAAKPEMDPLTEADALQEAQLLEVRLDAMRSAVGLLFELRLALQLRETNTGVLVAQGVRRCAWSAEPRPTRRTAWNVVASVPHCADRVFSLSLHMWPQARLELAATSAAFYTGNVPGVEGTPPPRAATRSSSVIASYVG